MTYREFPPSARTAPFVACYWTLEAAGAQRVVPDGRPELVLNLATPLEAFTDRWRPQPDRFVAGQIAAPLLLRPRGPVRILGVRFRPEGLRLFLGIPAADLASRTVPLADLSPTLDRRLARVHDIHQLDRALALATGHDRLRAAVDLAIGTAGLATLDSLAAAACWSPRQLERAFQEYVGLGPRLFCRIQRFQRVFAAMDRPAASLVHAALECGYYDQAHLVRDFRQFAGVVPTALLSPGSDLAAHFLSEISKTPPPAFE